MTRLLLPLLAVLSAAFVHGQTPANPTGHWEGVIQTPDLELKLQVDFEKNAAGEVRGTITIPAENIHGLPLKVAMDGRSITFHARRDQKVTGELSADGTTMAALFRVNTYEIPFTMTRTGEPRIAPPVEHAAIAPQFTGTWHGTLGAKALRITVILANNGDETASARVVNQDQGDLEIPATAITQADANLTLEFKAIGASYTATLNAEGNVLAGTFGQGAASVPLTLQRLPDGRK